MDITVTLLLLLSFCSVVWSQNFWSENYLVIEPQGTKLMACYECNVWKAGYGQLCDNPRIRTGCYACMKVETIIFMGYYKNTPRHSVVTSRACANSKSVPFYNECQYFTMGDGHSKRCYCNTPLCNTAVHRSTSLTLFTLVSAALLITLRNIMWS